MVWHYLRLPPWLLLAIPMVGCVLVLWLVASLTFCHLHDWSITWLAAGLFAALPWFFVSSGWLLHFDSWLVLGLLTVALVPSPWALAAACLATPWIDERFLLALPVCVAVRSVSLDWIRRPDRPKFCATWQSWRRRVFRMRRSARACGCREGRLNCGCLSRELEQGAVRAVDPVSRGALVRLPAGWVMIVVAAVLGARIGWPWAAAFVFLVLGTAIGGLFIAMDMSRTLMMISPLLLLGVWLWESWRPAAFDLFCRRSLLRIWFCPRRT